EREVMDDHELLVSGQLHLELDPVSFLLDCQFERRDRVFGGLGGGAAMSDHERASSVTARCPGRHLPGIIEVWEPRSWICWALSCGSGRAHILACVSRALVTSRRRAHC